jgi:3-hydroxyisobutyrate dehydrogenase-like beta-hydroxyacid dehydrogenase
MWDMKIAVLGMGRMGAALALRLQKGGHEVVAWNRSPGKAADVVAAGGREAGSVQDALSDVEVVLVSLTDDSAVREVALGPGGLVEWVGGDIAYVEMSTVSPALIDELAGTFAHFVAMPVLGGPVSVEKGEVTYLAGGDVATVDRLAPLLATLGGTVRRYPAPPLASTAKLAVNLLLLAGVVSLAEAFAVGRSGGLDDDQLYDLLAGAVAPGVKPRFGAVLGQPSAGWWATALGAKDAGLAVAVAHTAGVDLQVAQAVQAAYGRAAAQGYADEDIAAVHHLYLG